jgi:hypothetical protein
MSTKLMPVLIFTIILLGLVPVATQAAEFQLVEPMPDSSELRFDNVAASTSAVSAEYLLTNLAENNKSMRINGSRILFVCGGLAAIDGAILNNESSSNWYDYSKIEVLVGIIDMCVPSLPEKYYIQMIKITDPDEREKAAAGYLSALASNGKTSRLVWGIIETLSAAYCYSNLADNDQLYRFFDNQYGAFLFTASAIKSFLVKSPEEMVWDTYEANRDSSETVPTAFQFGVNPENRALGVVYKLTL